MAEIWPCRYTIDSSARIVSVSSEWLEFAAENDAPELTRSAVVGTSLMKWISGAETQQLWMAIFDRVRRGSRLRLPFRCDSPDVRRFMEMELWAEPDGSIEIATRLIRVEKRPFVALLEVTRRHTEEPVTVCSWCKKIEVSSEWLEIEDAVFRLRLMEGRDLPNLSHGLCSECPSIVVKSTDIGQP